jgi:hypothetical protein
MRNFRWQLQALAVLAVAGFVGFAYNRVIDSLTDDNRRVMPEIAGAGNWLALAAVATLPYLVYLLVRHARAAIRDRSRAYRALYWTGSLLLHALLAGGVALLVLAAHPDFLFAPRLIEEVDRPDGAQIGYLYRDGLFCGYSAYIRDRGDAELRKVASVPRDRCDEPVHLAWRDGGRVEIVDARGEPLPAQTWDLTLFRH